MPTSPMQQAIYDLAPSRQSFTVNAVAGSGKTTTGLAFIERVLPDVQNVLYCAFNKHIVEAVTDRLHHNQKLDCRTIHSLCFQQVKLESDASRATVKANKYDKLVAAVLDAHSALWRDLGYSRAWDAVPSFSKLVDFVRLTLTPPDAPDAIHAMAATYSLLAPATWLEFIPSILTVGAKQAARQGLYDFTDMIYLLNRWDVALDPYDFIFLDEAQDLNATQLASLRRFAGPESVVMACGDPHQSIMQFSGSALDSFTRVKAGLCHDKEMPLSVCYRCPTSVVALAQEMVPHIAPAPDAIEGEVRNIHESELADLVRPGDMVLCRTNAPLVSVCLAFIRRGIPAHIRGRDIGASLAAIVTSVKATTLSHFPDALDAWEENEHTRLTKAKAGEGAFDVLHDKVDCVRAAFAGMNPASIEDFAERLKVIFSEDNAPNLVTFSSIHRAKGLEAPNVFILHPEKLSTDLEAERNVKYVAVTRAMQSLSFVRPTKAIEERW